MSDHAVVTREEWLAARKNCGPTPGRDLVVPYYHQLLDQTPKGRQDEFLAVRSDEYSEVAVGS
jgi:predicted dithiol-disulfide oxidoreductase (DUF899 family)